MLNPNPNLILILSLQLGIVVWLTLVRDAHENLGYNQASMFVTNLEA